MNKFKKHIFISIPVIIVIGVLFHFLYDWTGNNFLIGLFAPVNESIFEHTKLSTFPIILFYIGYFCLNKDLDRNKWFRAMFYSIITSCIFVIGAYYFASAGLKIDSMIVDIGIYMISIVLGELVSCHYYTNISKNPNFILTVVLVILISAVKIYFTLMPMHKPYFKDPITETYGIKEEI